MATRADTVRVTSRDCRFLGTVGRLVVPGHCVARPRRAPTSLPAPGRYRRNPGTPSLASAVPRSPSRLSARRKADVNRRVTASQTHRRQDHGEFTAGLGIGPKRSVPVRCNPLVVRQTRRSPEPGDIPEVLHDMRTSGGYPDGAHHAPECGGSGAGAGSRTWSPVGDALGRAGCEVVAGDRHLAECRIDRGQHVVRQFGACRGNVRVHLFRA